MQDSGVVLVFLAQCDADIQNFYLPSGEHVPLVAENGPSEALMSNFLVVNPQLFRVRGWGDLTAAGLESQMAPLHVVN